MTIREYMRKKILGVIKLSRIQNLPSKEEKLTFISDVEQLMRQRVREYNVWYEGDSDEILNFYTRETAINYNYEPFYSRNKKNYFWSISSTEGDIKRTHSGQAKNIIDTLVSIIGVPDVKAGHAELPTENSVNTVLQEILEENNFWENIYKQDQLPMTMVEGWGCYKIAWDKDISDNPYPIYYRAEDVDFIMKANRIIGVMFKDYYTNGKKNYLVTETRYIDHGNLKIETEIFEMLGGNDEDTVLKKVNLDELPEMRSVEPNLEVTNCKKLLAVPCIFYKDSSGLCPGRSLLNGKIDLLDDLDQCLSQASSSVRKSTPIEYFDINFLPRTKHGLPKPPTVYDRKYITYEGNKGADGEGGNTNPVTTTQPQINFEQYDKEAMAILLQIMNGLISPATLGLDVAKKDNAEAQREKEKITVFTRQNISGSETKILTDLFSQLLCAKELMDHNEITTFDYNITVSFPEFADDSYENKIGVLGEQLDKGNLSHEMYLSKLYGGRLDDSAYERELKFLKEMHKPDENEQQEGLPESGEGDEGLEEAFQEQNMAKDESQGMY